jgi:hypothetical protein
MRELSVRIRFMSPSLGNEKNPKTGRFSFMRSPGSSGKILFLSTWHAANMQLAAEMLGRHQELIKGICWDIEIDAELRDKCLERCYYKKTPKGRDRWSTHESLVKGQTANINCVVPHGIDDTDFWALMQLSGKYKGLSPWQPGKHGHYEVVSIRPRRQPQLLDENNNHISPTDKKNTN